MNKKAVGVVIIILTFILSSCSTAKNEDLFPHLLELCGENTEENGYFYLSSALEEEPTYMSEQAKKLLYGVGAESSFQKLEAFSIFVSSRTPYELALLECRSASDTAELAKMCLRRADSIKVTLRYTPYEEASRDIRVCVSGHFVLMCFSEANNSVEAAFYRLT